MKKRQLGETGIEVSILGLGAAPLAGLYREVPETQAIETIHAALDAGVNLIDTAPKYGMGLSEQRLGLALKHVPRHAYTIATKVGWNISQGDRPVPDFTRDGVLRGVEQSLERLGLDAVDVLHIHDADRHYEDAIENAYPALDDLRSQGAIKAVSVGVNWSTTLEKFMRDGDFDCFMLANQYSLLTQDGLSVLDTCADLKIGIMLAGVFATGILATGAVSGAKYRYRDAPPEIMETTRQLEALCNRHGITLQSAALQFGLSHPAVSSLVIGYSSPDRVVKNIDAIETTIPAAFWHELRESDLIDAECPLPL